MTNRQQDEDQERLIVSGCEIPSPLLDFTIPFELTNGNSRSGKKKRRSCTKRDAEIMIKKHFHRDVPKIRLKPVTIKLFRILGIGHVLWDGGNVLCGNAKQLIDALVSTGVLVDDSLRYVSEPILYEQIHDNRELGPATRIAIWRTKDLPQGYKDVTKWHSQT